MLSILSFSVSWLSGFVLSFTNNLNNWKLLVAPWSPEINALLTSEPKSTIVFSNQDVLKFLPFGVIVYADAFSKSQPFSTDEPDLSYRLDGNNVDINTESSELAKNQLRYYALIDSMSQEFGRIKMVLSKA